LSSSSSKNSSPATHPPEVLDALLAGDDARPDQYYFRTVVTIESASHPEFEQSLYVASCVRDANRVRYRAYRVT